MKLLFALLFTLSIISCSQDPIEKFESIDSKENLDIKTQKHPLLEQLIEQGFDKKNIEEFEEYFLVEGDILFWKQKKYNFKTPTTKQRSYPLGSVEISTISVYINPNMDINWKNAAQSAINRWNNSNSAIELFQINDSDEADISIMYDTQYSNLPLLPPTIWGQGDWPSSGNPGEIVRINPNSTLCSETQETRIGLIQHELGHNLGLKHTDENSGNLIPGTPSQDPNSIMNSGSIGCSTLENGFSYYDLVAIKYLYPKPNIPVYKVTANGPDYMGGANFTTWNYTGNVPNAQNIVWWYKKVNNIGVAPIAIGYGNTTTFIASPDTYFSNDSYRTSDFEIYLEVSDGNGNRYTSPIYNIMKKGKFKLGPGLQL